MKTIRTSLLAVAAAVTLFPLVAQAQFARPTDAIKYRQSAYSLMGTHFGRLGAMANGKVPFDAKVAAENAALVATLAKLPGAAFPPGSDTGGNTRAKPEIWKDTAKFSAAYEKMVAEAAKLPAAAGEAGTLKTAFGAVLQTCNACHDDFRRD
jgi:cytochrome c556